MHSLSGSIRVLHVEDTDGADLVAASLERADERFEVETAASASAGLDRLADGEFDCIVSEYDLPDETGVDFLEAVRERHPALPFVLFTDAGSEAVASEAVAAGVTDYLPRASGPEQEHSLADRIASAVAEYRSRRRLDASADRLSAFIEQSAIGVIEWDDEFNVVRMNDAAVEILGYSRESLAGESWAAIVPESEREALAPNVTALLENRESFHSVNENVREDGERITCEWHNRVVTDEAGDVVGVFSQFWDVTERRERERAVEALHSTAQALMGAATASEVADTIVEAARDVLDMRSNSVHLYDERADHLTPVSWSDRAEELLGDVPPFEPGASLAWTVFETGEAKIYGDVSTVPGRLNEDTPIRSEIILPLDGHGVVLASSVERDAFDEADVSLARTLAAHATTALDRIERKRELREERTFIDQALDTINDVFYVLGPDGELRRWNAHAAETVGYSDEEIEEMDLSELFPPEDYERVAEGVERTLREGYSSVEADLLTADGERIPHEFVGSRLTDTDGELAGVVGIGRDVSDRKLRERKLTALHDVAVDLETSESVEYICERTIQASQDILAFDLSVVNLEEDGYLTVAAVSEEVPEDGTKVMSVDEGIAGKTYRTGESILVEDIADHEEANPQGPFRSAISIPVGDHGVFQAVSEASGTFDESDLELAELLCSHTENALNRLDHERQLERQNERLEEFASIVSHDLRNPLNVADGRLELVEDECDSEHLEIARRAHERMETLIDDLLTLAREGETPTEVEAVSLADMANECWRTVETAEATLVTETDRAVMADAGQLRQLLENLISNAVEHGGEDVTVTVGDLTDGFYVADDGPGIPEDERADVFEVGYSSARGGTGFGLSIVAQVADAHGWDVGVTEGRDGGARFEVTGVETRPAPDSDAE